MLVQSPPLHSSPQHAGLSYMVSSRLMNMMYNRQCQGLSIIKYPHVTSNLPWQCKYNILTTEFHRLVGLADVEGTMLLWTYRCWGSFIQIRTLLLSSWLEPCCGHCTTRKLCNDTSVSYIEKHRVGPALYLSSIDSRHLPAPAGPFPEQWGTEIVCQQIYITCHIYLTHSKYSVNKLPEPQNPESA